MEKKLLPMAEDRIIVHSTYYNPIEANIIKTRLEASGIPCFLTDEMITAVNPLYNQAVGGVKLNIFERDIEVVNSLLQEEYNGNEVEPSESSVICEKCGSSNVSYSQATKNRFSWWVSLIALVFSSYPVKANKCFHCYDCGHEFQ